MLAMVEGPLWLGTHGRVATLVATGGASTESALAPAPVPRVEPPGVSPADRVAGPGSPVAAGPVNSTPFSATPSGMLSEGGEQTSQHDRTLAPTDGTGVTPNLGR
jgi:hypothetical protein